MSYVSESRQKTMIATRRGEHLSDMEKSAYPIGDLAASGDTSFLFGGGTRTTRNYQFFRNWVYSVTNWIGRKASGQDICAGQLTGADPNPERSMSRFVKSISSERGLRDVRQKAADQELEIIQTHPALDLLAKPNHMQSQQEFVYTWTVNMLIMGEAYLIGDAEELWSIPTNWIEPVHKNGLFRGYKLTFGKSGTNAPEVPPEFVARSYYPDPSDPRKAFSPLQAIYPAVRVDDFIQESQEQMFERGIFPNLAISIGQTTDSTGKPTGRRPRLKGWQRRQLIMTVREIWRNTVSRGEPAILDGLIEKVEKMTNSPREMDWSKSGEIVKDRITQAYGLNPIVLGQITGVNRAQAAVARQSAYDDAVNPLTMNLSRTLTDFLGPLYETPSRLVLWVEPCVAEDATLTTSQWNAARAKDDVSRNEYRAEILGLPPVDEEKAERPELLNTVGGMTGGVQILTALGQGFISEDAAKEMFTLFYGDEEAAARLVAGAPTVAPPGLPAPPDSDDEDEDIEDEETDRLFDSLLLLSNDASKKKDWTVDTWLAIGDTPTRKNLQGLHVKQISKHERRMAIIEAIHFRRVAKDVAKNMLDMDGTPNNVETILKFAFDYDKYTRELFDVSREPMGLAFVNGAISEVKLTASITKQTSAEEIAERLDIDVPEGVSLQHPKWLQEAATEQLDETFHQDYWLDVHKTTRNDMQRVLEAGLLEGKSIRKLAKEIVTTFGGAYTRVRGERIARTEIPDMLNAGHASGIEQIESESGIPMGKEWLSVFGTTTRDDHAAADAQVVGTKELFDVGGEQARWPADGNLSAGQRCNCQCTIISSFLAEGLDDKPKEDESEDEKP